MGVKGFAFLSWSYIKALAAMSCRKGFFVADEDKDDKDKEKAEGGVQGETGEGAGKPKSNKKMMIIIAVIVTVVVLGGAAGAFFMLHKSGGDDKNRSDAMSSGGAGGGGEEKKAAVYYSLGDLLVNLSGEGKHPNFLKVKISLELADEKDLPLMDAIKPRIVDNFQVYLRELRIEDLRGSAGMYRLREELLMRVTEAAQPVRIRDVLFQEMLVQ
jgi:flagellar FliL protein